MADDSLGFRDTRAGRWLGRALSKAAAVLILLGVGAGTGALISPGLPEQLLPYGEGSLGQTAGAPIRINRDYDVPDPEATERRRAAAVEDIRPVYDFDTELRSEVESRVSESFAFARSQASDLALQSARSPKARSGSAAPDPLREDLMGRLQSFIEQRDFVALRDEGFSRAAEEALTALVHAALSQFVLEDRALLPAARDRGITVRKLPEGVGHVVTDLQSLRDLTAARSEVERAAETLPGALSPELRRALGHLARGALRPNLTYDAGETARRRTSAGEDVPPVVLHFSRGERILEAGERIDQRHLMLFRAIRAQGHPEDVARSRLGGGLFAMLLAFLCYKLARPLQGRRPTRRDALFAGVVLLLNLALTQGFLLGAALLRDSAAAFPVQVAALNRVVPLRLWADLWEALPYAMPVTAGTILVRLLLGPELTALYAICAAALFGLMRGGSLPYALFALAGALVAARRARGIAHRRQLFGVGAYVASTNVALILCSALLSGRLVSPQLPLELAAAVIGSVLFTPLVVGAATPLFEGLFGYVSDSRLAMLCNLNHPALKELIVRAPGTYHHSILLADLAAAAASAIGGNPLLAKTIGLYHDLGKARSPLSFSENQKGRDSEPLTTALLETLEAHVAEGVELGKRYKLPRLVLDAIAQHHGTRRVALSAHGGGTLSARSYPGPRPRSRETAIVLLADAVEAQGRTLSARDGPKLRELVQATVAEIASEGELDDSGLTLGQLPEIVDSFSVNLLRTLEQRGPTLPEAPPRLLSHPGGLRST